MREVCGTVSGMLMVFRAKGLDILIQKHLRRKLNTINASRNAPESLKKKNGSIICRELLGLDQREVRLTAIFRQSAQKEYYKKRPCVDLVGDAAEILEKFYIK